MVGIVERMNESLYIFQSGVSAAIWSKFCVGVDCVIHGCREEDLSLDDPELVKPEAAVKKVLPSGSVRNELSHPHNTVQS